MMMMNNKHPLANNHRNSRLHYIIIGKTSNRPALTRTEMMKRVIMVTMMTMMMAIMLILDDSGHDDYEDDMESILIINRRAHAWTSPVGI